MTKASTFKEDLLVMPAVIPWNDLSLSSCSIRHRAIRNACIGHLRTLVGTNRLFRLLLEYEARSPAVSSTALSRESILDRVCIVASLGLPVVCRQCCRSLEKRMVRKRPRSLVGCRNAARRQPTVRMRLKMCYLSSAHWRREPSRAYRSLQFSLSILVVGGEDFCCGE